MKHQRKVLAVSSGGGHWVQLLRLRPALAGFHVTYATVDPTCRSDVAAAPLYTIPDANRSKKFQLIILILRIFWIFLCVRPHCMVTTGAAPGYVAVRIGRLFRVRTLFIDSIANAEHLSLSAHLSLKHASLTLTQWSHLSEENDRATFRGSLL